ncbi:MAG: hypothetical protein ACK4YQ_16890 [Phenylobacterium sp.]|uniref:hypothetical protein n=1 Tax=Phenylobacterium sp. TaxID=1871053 RepID=UPI00391D05F4
MSRKPAKRAVRRKSDKGTVAWAPEHEKVFALAGDDWTRPATIAVTRSQDGTRWTLDGVFKMANGHPVRLRSRLRRLKDGSLRITEETMSLRFFARSEAPTQGGGPEALQTCGEPPANGVGT